MALRFGRPRRLWADVDDAAFGGAVLRHRFSIGRVCVVADRGMISAATIEGLEARKLEYILGARERSDAIVRKIVLENEDFLHAAARRAQGGRDAALRQAGEERRQALYRLPQ